MPEAARPLDDRPKPPAPPRGRRRSFFALALALAFTATFARGKATASEPEQAAASDVPFELEIPFKCGSKVTVSQSHGTYSHVGNDTWAWDFREPVGTPVTAARAGVVRVVRADSTRGGCDKSFGPDANYVVISHEAGLETQYLHLSRVDVKPGQAVKAGEVLGAVGETGWACGAHLHFQLQRAVSTRWANPSVPAKFRVAGDPVTDTILTSDNCGQTVEPAIAHAAGNDAAANGATAATARSAQASAQ